MTIKLYWMGGAKNEINFGDTLSPFLIKQLTNKEVKYSPVPTCHVVAIGSLLQKVAQKKIKRRFFRPFNKIKIWGTGSFSAENLNGIPADFFAVRGPLTRDSLGLPQDTPLGDPGLLINTLVTNWKKSIIVAL